MAVIAFMSGSSMNGPFLCERMLLRLPLHNELVSSFVITRLVAEGGLSPRRHRVISLDSAFAAAMRMIDRVHDHAANRRADAHVTRSACFSDRHVFVIQISNLSDSRDAIDVNEPDFTGWQLHVSVSGFLC